MVNQINKTGSGDANTGQLLKYRIPHRFETTTTLAPSWCSHCGSMLHVGRKIVKCAECNKGAHKECMGMVPKFCGLKPDMAKVLVQAFEDHEKKSHQRELEEAEKARKQAVPDAAEVMPEKVVEMPKPVEQVKPPSPKVVEVQRISEPVSARPLPTPPIVKADIPRVNISLDDFRFLAVLGRGAFGKVMLASDNHTKQLYAIKALKKEFIIQNDDVKSTKLEKRVFQLASTAKHPFLVNLHSCFETETRVYFVMEYLPGGDLMSLMMNMKRFGSVMVKFYLVQVILAIEYFHQNNIVYRYIFFHSLIDADLCSDLKLENILVCPNGYIKLADYGICKDNIGYGTVTRTFCGTPGRFLLLFLDQG